MLAFASSLVFLMKPPGVSRGFLLSKQSSCLPHIFLSLYINILSDLRLVYPYRRHKISIRPNGVGSDKQRDLDGLGDTHSILCSRTGFL